MKPTLIVTLFLSALTSSCQVHWEESSNWTLYQYEGRRVLEIPVDSLKFVKHSLLKQDSMMYFIKSATIPNTKGPHAWMGGYIVTCTVKQTLRKIEISNYGGYFYDPKAGTYYQIPTEKIDDWLSFIQNAYLNMIGKK